MPRTAPGAGRAGGRSEFAPAKINLTLRVLGRRADFYHDIESLVVFSRDLGDRLSFAPADKLDLALRGPGATALAGAENLVLKAALALAARVEGVKLGRFVLTKRLPVAAGIGGGSADAAAALRLLARANGIALDDTRLFAAARATGADVPVCLDPQARAMRGIGDVLSAPLKLPLLPAVLVNPGVAIATRDAFAKLELSPGETLRHGDAAAVPQDRRALLLFLNERSNDLEGAATSLQPIIAQVLGSLRAIGDCRLARMSGSGATCFALFDSQRAAAAAARSLQAAHPPWWVRATVLG